jgi:hypothetical protein
METPPRTPSPPIERGTVGGDLRYARLIGAISDETFSEAISALVLKEQVLEAQKELTSSRQSIISEYRLLTSMFQTRLTNLCTLPEKERFEQFQRMIEGLPKLLDLFETATLQDLFLHIEHLRQFVET